jgi:hypothetical protein
VGLQVQIGLQVQRTLQVQPAPPFTFLSKPNSQLEVEGFWGYRYDFTIPYASRKVKVDSFDTFDSEWYNLRAWGRAIDYTRSL